MVSSRLACQIYLTKISNEIKKFTKETTDEEKVKKIYRASPPLVALETLTNSTMSFIAQYAGFKNENTTFGNTSISAYYAIKQALNALKNKKKAVVNKFINCLLIGKILDYTQTCINTTKTFIVVRLS